MYMTVKRNVIEFEWNSGNLDKSYLKHGITPKEAEEVFINDQFYIVPDIKHSEIEPRFILLGKNQAGKMIFVVFTVRKDKIRVISARRMHQKEVDKYEKAQKNT